MCASEPVASMRSCRSHKQPPACWGHDCWCHRKTAVHSRALQHHQPAVAKDGGVPSTIGNLHTVELSGPCQSQHDGVQRKLWHHLQRAQHPAAAPVGGCAGQQQQVAEPQGEASHP